MTRLRLAAIFAVIFASALTAMIPLRVALTLSGAEASVISARNVTGTLWNGRLEEARIRGVSLGDVGARLDPFALLTGAGRLRLVSDEGSAALALGSAQGIENANFSISLPLLAPGLAPAGEVRLQDATLLFAGGQCAEARGRIFTDLFQRNWDGPELSGELSCAGSAVAARLFAASPEAEIEMTVLVDAGGRYRLQSRVMAGAGLDNVLLMAGFRDSANGLTRIDEGMLGS